MNKNYIFRSVLLSFVFITNALISQVNFTSAHFPVIGNKSTYKIYVHPKIYYPPIFTSNYWDLSHIDDSLPDKIFTENRETKPAKNIFGYSDANCYIKMYNGYDSTFNHYFNISPTKIDFVVKSHFDPVISYPQIALYNKNGVSLKYLNRTMQVNDNLTDNKMIVLRARKKDINLPYTFYKDSIFYISQYGSSTKTIKNATLKLPNGTFNCILIEYAHGNILSYAYQEWGSDWQPGDGEPGWTGTGVLVDNNSETTDYYFYSPLHQSHIARMTTYPTFDGVYIQSFEYLTAETKANANIVSKAKINVDMYPNPATEIVHISTDNNEKISVQLFDISGKLVLESAELESNKTINTKGLTKGIYLALIKNNLGEMQQEKLIID